MEISLNKSLDNVVDTVEKKALEVNRAELRLEIEKVKLELQNAYNNFEYVNDALMVDFYTYQIKAYEAKFEYLIKLAKEMDPCQL